MPDVSDLNPMDQLAQPSAPLGLLADLAAERFGDTPFLSDLDWAVHRGQVRNFAEFAQAISAMADRLWAGGVRAGDTVAVVQRNHIEVEAVMCAVGRTGALPALLSSAMEVGELIESVAKLDRPWVLLDDFGFKRLAESRFALQALGKGVISLTGRHADWVSPLDDSSPHTANPRGVDDWFVVTHSSGTTGAPKLAAHSTRSLFGMVAPMIMIFRTQYSREDMNAKHLSFVHARTCAGTLASLETGIPALSIADPEPEHVRRLLLEHRPSSLETHPNVYIHWEPIAADASRPFAPVQRFISTFDAIHPRTVRALLAGSDRPDAHYLQGYGQTESGPITLRIVGREEAETYSPRNVGSGGGPYQVRIVDAGGKEVPVGQTGFIETLSPGRIRAYIGGAQIPADDEWFPMGDVGRLLPDGSLELLDRIVEHVDGTGSLLEKEDELLDRLPNLVELVLVKSEDGDEVFAVACTRAGADCSAEEFWAVAGELGLGKIPIRFWDWEALPLTGSYKVRRGVLRQRLASRVTRTRTGG